MEQGKSINPFKFNFHVGDVGHSVVEAPAGMGMSFDQCLLQEQDACMGDVVVLDVGPSHRRYAQLMRNGRKVNTRTVPAPKNEPYYRQYDKRK